MTDRSPRLLALETSTESCSVALLTDGVMRQKAISASLGHSEHLLPLVSELLAESGLALSDLDAIAYGAGPGAFTGLRLACGVAQGLALGAGLPVIAVGSLEALALSAGQEWVYACLDARMGEVYFAACRVFAGEVEFILMPGVAPPQLAGQPPSGQWQGVGTGFAAHGADLAQRLGPAVTLLDPALLPNAAAVARLAATRLTQGADAGTAQPLYIRDKVALTTAERLARGGKA